MSIPGRYPNAWGIDRINQRNLPLDDNSAMVGDGTGVNVYVIDSGILTTHQEFGGRVRPGYSAIGNENDWVDCNGHGTHASGTIGSSEVGLF